MSGGLARVVIIYMRRNEMKLRKNPGVVQRSWGEDHTREIQKDDVVMLTREDDELEIYVRVEEDDDSGNDFTGIVKGFEGQKVGIHPAKYPLEEIDKKISFSEKEIWVHYPLEFSAWEKPWLKAAKAKFAAQRDLMGITDMGKRKDLFVNDLTDLLESTGDKSKGDALLGKIRRLPTAAFWGFYDRL
jgi:hypothetical protein